MFVPTVPKFVWLNTLNVSARNCKYVLSPRSFVFLKSDKSQRWKLGPVTTPRPELPGRLEVCRLGVKADVLKNDAMVWVAP